MEVGPYADFGTFRDCVVRELESGRAGSKFPTLIFHSDSDGQWSPSEARELEKELATIGEEFRRRPPISIEADWQKEVIETFGLQVSTLYDCFFDVDGEPLLERLINLARLSQRRMLSILFQ
ncbi:MAG TPA: Imm70 family immunity protein [Bradyrhizobium sp.]|nr:Imm70 family immunity protein [Bradyrhizobium sp.]